MLCAPAFLARNTKKKHKKNASREHLPKTTTRTKSFNKARDALFSVNDDYSVQFGKLIQPLCIVRQAGLWALGTNSEWDVGGPALAELMLWL